MSRKTFNALTAVGAAALALAPLTADASNHREAPITALDHKADITDVWAFVPTDDPNVVALILSVDPLLEPGNGPTIFPFDPGILYEIKIDNNHDAVADITFQFQFTTEYQLPGVFTAAAGFGPSGANDIETGSLVVPPQIKDFNNPGLNLRQTYTVTMIKNGVKTQILSKDGKPFFAVPCNVGPRTMDYQALFDAGAYENLNLSGFAVWAGTSDDPFFIDLGAAFDTANLRKLGSGVPGVLTTEEEAARQNFASDTVSGYAVNTIVLDVPIAMLTADGQKHVASDPKANIGVWATTSRPRVTVRRSPFPSQESGGWRQVQRMGNPLINELLIGIGSKDRFSMDEPKNDSQFADFFLNPPIAQVIEALYAGALDVPEGPRTDLLPLVTYTNPIPGAKNPIADLLRLNTGVPATPTANINRMGLIAGDPAGYPNGRRLEDDVVDITLRVGVGGVLNPAFNHAPNNILGDGVNVNDAPFRSAFPYVANSPSGRNRRHIDPGELFPDGRPVPVE